MFRCVGLLRILEVCRSDAYQGYVFSQELTCCRCCFTPSQNGQPPQPANATALATVTTVSTYSKYAVSTFSSSFCNLNVDGPTCWLTMTTSTVTGCTASFGGIVGNQPVPCETAYATSAFYSISSGIPSTFSAPSPSSSVSSSTTVSSSTASYMGISASSTLLSSPSPRGSTPTPASFPKIDGASTQRQGTSKAGESRFGTPYQRPTPYFAKPSQLTSKSGGKSKSSTLPVSKGFARTPTGLAY